MRKGIVTLALLCTLVSGLAAQDIHFSQFFTSPLLLNPALTGMFYGTYRFTSNYRNQWASVTVPYKTTDFTADMRLTPGHSRYSKTIYGIGMQVYADRAGDGNYAINYTGLTLAVNKSLDDYGTKYLGGGVMLSEGTTRVNYASLKFDNNQQIYVPENAGSGYSFFDFSMGLLYTNIPTKTSSFYIGIADYHINRPVISFTGNTGSRLFSKYVLSAGSDKALSKFWDLDPRVMISFQGKQYDALAGTFFRYKLADKRREAFGVYFGEWYRYNDAFISVIRFDANNMSFGISYDVNTSKLIPASGAQGAVEFSFIYIGKIKQLFRPKIYCPRF